MDGKKINKEKQTHLHVNGLCNDLKKFEDDFGEVKRRIRF